MGFVGFIGFIGFVGFIGFTGFVGFIGFIGFTGFTGFTGFRALGFPCKLVAQIPRVESFGLRVSQAVAGAPIPEKRWTKTSSLKKYECTWGCPIIILTSDLETPPQLRNPKPGNPPSI